MIAADGKEISQAGGISVTASSNIVKIRRVTWALADGINSRVNKSYRGLIDRSRLLIDQSHESSPKRCANAGAAYKTRGAVVVNGPDQIGDHRDIWQVTHDDRAQIGRHVYPL